MKYVIWGLVILGVFVGIVTVSGWPETEREKERVEAHEQSRTNTGTSPPRGNGDPSESYCFDHFLFAERDVNRQIEEAVKETLVYPDSLEGVERSGADLIKLFEITGKARVINQYLALAPAVSSDQALGNKLVVVKVGFVLPEADWVREDSTTWPWPPECEVAILEVYEVRACTGTLCSSALVEPWASRSIRQCDRGCEYKDIMRAIGKPPPHGRTW